MAASNQTGILTDEGTYREPQSLLDNTRGGLDAEGIRIKGLEGLKKFRYEVGAILYKEYVSHFCTYDPGKRDLRLNNLLGILQTCKPILE